MDNRNQPRSRKDSVTDKERRGMQQGYPVREDAAQSFDRPVNRPTGPREVPQSMRQGKIPVRENASTGRTLPVMNRSGQPIRTAPADIPTPPPTTIPEPETMQLPLSEEVQTDMPVQEEAVSVPDLKIEETEENAAADTPEAPEVNEEAAWIPDTAGIDTVSADTVGTEPVSKELFPADTTGNTADPLPVQDPEETAVPVPVQEPEETAVPVPVQEPEETETELLPEEKEEEEAPETAEPDPAPAETTAEKPVPEASCAVETEPPAADEASGSPAEDGNDNVSAPETEETDKSVPKSTEQPEETPVPAEETADAEEQDPDEELLMILHRRKKAQAEEPAAPPAPEKTPADVPADPVEEQEADEPAVSETASTTGKGGRKLWILPIVIAILASIALLIGIPAFSEPAETVPDFDMTLNYGEPETEMETGIPSETDGAGREEQPVTETTPPAVKFNVTLDFFDRDPLTVSTSEITLEALLERVNYVILDTDRFSVDLSALLTEETTITVDTVTYGTARETITIPFETKTTNVQTIPRGQRNVTQYGKDGSKTITYTTEIVNGVEVSRTVAKEEITVQPVTETCQVGIGGTLVGNDGKTYSYSYYRMVNATYYDIEGLTYLGYEADESVVAVDMDYIPLGTKIYVKNDQFDFGVRVAADTGSMIEGWEVDIWLDDSNPQKADFAYIGYVKNMIIYYLD